MSNYSPITNFGAKDGLSHGNPLKLIVGAAYDAEFNAIATAIATKYDSSTASITLSGTLTAATLVGALAAASLTGSHTLPDGVLSTNVPLLNAANVFSAGTQTVSPAAADAILLLAGPTTSNAYTKFQTNSIVRAYVGAPGTAGQLATGSSVGDLVLRSEGGNILFSISGGTATLKLDSSGVANFTTRPIITVADSAESLSLRGASGRLILFPYNAANSGAIIDAIDPTQTTYMPLGLYCSTLTYAGNGTVCLTLDGSGKVTTLNANAAEVGYKGAPSRAVSASDSTQAADAGKTIKLTGSSAGQTFTLNGNPPVESEVNIVNVSTQSWTIAASGTLINGGATGSITLIANAAARYWQSGAGVWIRLS